MENNEINRIERIDILLAKIIQRLAQCFDVPIYSSGLIEPPPDSDMDEDCEEELNAHETEKQKYML